MAINNDLVISPAPHIKSPDSTASIMWWFVFALLLPATAGVYFFGLRALLLIIVTVAAAVLSELLFQVLAKRKITIFDGSAVITGLLLALVLPPSIPFWMAIIGAIVAIVLVKGLFGGLGYNIFNPALVARAFLLASWPVAMTAWTTPFDAVTTATPLYLVNKLHQAAPDYLNLMMGNHAGSLGETSILAVAIAAIFLLWKKIIDWPAPVAFIGVVALLSYTLGHNPIFAVLSGGVVFGAVFMATDYATTPVTAFGQAIFGFGCGLITVLIRYFGGFPEGVNYSILIMNMLTPAIDYHVRPRLYGGRT